MHERQTLSHWFSEKIKQVVNLLQAAWFTHFSQRMIEQVVLKG
jgi:hypothetical protein